MQRKLASSSPITKETLSESERIMREQLESLLGKRELQKEKQIERHVHVNIPIPEITAKSEAAKMQAMRAKKKKLPTQNLGEKLASIVQELDTEPMQEVLPVTQSDEESSDENYEETEEQNFEQTEEEENAAEQFITEVLGSPAAASLSF